jgi:DNA modification methylase
MDWMASCPPNSFHAMVTDPPYGMREYSKIEIEKMRKGVGGMWRIPPSLDGYKRKPLPRFTVLTKKDLLDMQNFFGQWGRLAYKILVPGAHLVIASNPLLVYSLTNSLVSAGFENRGIIVRTVRTLKGGFRPKLAEKEFNEISSIPRSCWEPWALLRKPFKGRLSENLRKWGTGGLRRFPDGSPFVDLIRSGITPQNERKIAPHPSLKPQALIRQLVWAVLPLGKGKVIDPFCGGGSTLAAATALDIESVGIEIDPEYVSIAKKGIPRLAKLNFESISKPQIARVLLLASGIQRKLLDYREE